jgi:hypothetical protein
MPKEEQVWGVLFTSAGLSELRDALQHYLSEGPLGVYMICKKVDMGQPYFHVVVEYHNTDGSSFETEMYIPHHYIKLVAASTDRKQIGFLLGKDDLSTT